MGLSRPLGPVESISRSRLILVRIDRPDIVPEIGSRVVDANGFEIGKIVDIIGPITKPYAVVKPNSYSVLSIIKPSTILFSRSIKREKRILKGRSK